MERGEERGRGRGGEEEGGREERMGAGRGARDPEAHPEGACDSPSAALAGLLRTSALRQVALG